MIRHIYVRNTLAALHQWKDAPSQVSFLKNLHRHVFFIKTTFKVDHNDRDKEFFILQRNVSFFLDVSIPRDLETGLAMIDSCEDLAEKILTAFKDQGIVSCEVSEDAEN